MEEEIQEIRKPIKKKSAFAESFAVNFGLKFILGFIVIIVFLTTVQCSIKKPESPTFNTNLAVPLVNKTYLMPEILERIDQPGLSLDSSGEVMFTFEEELDTLTLTDDITTNDIHQSISNKLGQIDIAPTNTGPSEVPLSNFNLLTLGVIPDTSFDISDDLPVATGYTWADIASGGVYLKLTNELGINLDTVIVTIVEQRSHTDLVTAQLPGGLASGITDSVYFDLSGQRVTDYFGINMHCHTPGATAFSLTINNKIISQINFDDELTISAARAIIPEVSKDFSNDILIPDSNTIMQADIASGTMLLSINNGTNLPADIDITLDDFIRDGQPLRVIRSINANMTTGVNINLAGYQFIPDDQTHPQSIGVDVSALIPASASYITVDEDDSITVTTNITNISFASLTGIIEPEIVTFENISVDIDLPQGFDSLQLVSAVLQLDVVNGFNFPGSLDLDIYGDGGQLKHFTGNIDPGSPDNPVTSFIFDSSLATFMNPVPQQITISGTASFGDGITSGTITPEDYIHSKITISSPLEVILDRATFGADTTAEDMNQDDMDMITGNIISAEFSPTIINHLPFGVSVMIYMDSSQANLNADNAQLVIGPIDIAGGTLGADHTVSQPTTSIVSIALDSIDFKVLENDTLYSTQEVTLIGNGSSAIKVSGDDYITIRGVIDVEYKFDGDF
ncbi:MAG: hypothetical protein ABIJ45_05220 [Candidatus Zixiibacteriota bacterium]